MAGLSGLSDDAALLPCLLITALIFFTNVGHAEEILLTVNVKKPLAMTSDKFLSYTLDPTVVLTGNALTDYPERSVNMAKALSPAYVRIGGPRSNSYTFERPHRLQREEDPAFTITEANWIDVHRWADDAGLDIVACIAPQHSESGGRDPSWDSRNALDLISFSDYMGFNTSWQLGYECQTRCDISGVDIGRDVMRLRSMLDAFPRYSKSIVTGPDVVTYRSKHQQQYLQDYLNLAGNALSAITWHPDFAGVTLDAYGVSMHHDTLAVDRDGLYRVVGRMIAKKPLWLAEAKPEACKKQFLGALVWTRRLGNAARLGAQVIMRQPSNSDLFQPTPDYWVSVLHKALVGREVLDAKITSGNRTHVHFYCQCTRPSSKYEKGSLTIFGINLTPVKISINLKGLKVKNIHKYILLPGYDAENRMFSETVLLNNEPLSLVNYDELPEIRPAISTNNKGVSLKLPSGGIGFWVLPGLKIKVCGGVEDDNTDKMLLRKMSKRVGEPDSAEYSVHEDDESEDKDYDIMSMDDRRYNSRMSKPKRRRKYHYSEEDESTKSYKKYDARMDLERLERLLRRRDSYDDRKPRGRGHFVYDDRTLERLNENEDEDIEEETVEEIRAKLEEYKKRLREYESKNKKIDLRSREKMIEPTEVETIDSEKVIEAMKLISKMENAMGSFEKSVDDVSPIDALNQDVVNDAPEHASSGKSVNPEDTFLDELLKSKTIKRTSVPRKIEDQLHAIYQMLAEEKERRQRNIIETTVTQIPVTQPPVTQIPITQPPVTQPPVTQPPVTQPPEADNSPEVDSLEVDSSEDEENGVEPTSSSEKSLTRTRRDLSDQKFDDNPHGLRKKGIFRRLGWINDEARERRAERRNSRRVNDGQTVISDPQSSFADVENNFDRFHQHEPLNDFPEADKFVEIGEEEAKKALGNYDYVKDDDDDNRTKLLTRPTKRSENTVGSINQNDSREEKWIEDYNKKLRHLPMEFYENVKMAVPRVRDDLTKHVELSEAVLIDDKPNNRFDNVNNNEPEISERIVPAPNFGTDFQENGRIKGSTVKKLIGYYDNPQAYQEKAMDYADNERLENTKNIGRTSEMRESMNSRLDTYRPDPGVVKKPVKDLTSGDYDDFTDFDSMQFGRTAVDPIQNEQALGIYEVGYQQWPFKSAKRIKRSSGNLEDILDREMIFEDDNNLKDCECRVVRGTGASEKLNSLKLGELHRNGRRSDRPDCRRIAEEISERRKQRKREGPQTVKPASRFDKDYMHKRSKRHVKYMDEEMDDFMEMEPEFIDEESFFTAEDEDAANEEADDLRSYVEMAIDGAQIGDGLGIEGPMDLTIEDEDEHSKFSHLMKRENDEITASLQDHERTTVGLESVDKEETEVTDSSVTREENSDKEDLEVTKSLLEKAGNVSEEESQVTTFPATIVENVDTEGEAEVEKSLVKRANNIANEELEVTESPVKMVNDVTTETTEVTNSLIKRVDNYGAEDIDVKKESELSKSPVKLEDIVTNEELELSKSAVKLEDTVTNEEPEVPKSPVQLEDIVAHEEPDVTKFPVKRAYTSKRKVGATESPSELVNNVASSDSKDLAQSSGVKLEKTKKPRNSLFRGNRSNKGNSKETKGAPKINQTNTSDSKLHEPMEGIQTETPIPETGIAESPSIQVESRVIEPPSVEAESRVIKPPSVEAESRVAEPRSTAVDSRIDEPRTIETESKVDEHHSSEVESKVAESRSIKAKSKDIEPRSIKLKSKVVEHRSTDTETKIAELRSTEAESKFAEPSSIAVITKTEDSSITVPIRVTEEPSGKIGQDNSKDERNSTTSNTDENQETSKLTSQSQNKDGDGEIKVKRENVETSLNSTAIESPATSTDDVKVSIPSVTTKNDPKTEKKTPPKPKLNEKITDPVKAREARISAHAEALAALKRENDERRIKKTRESTSRILAMEHSRNAQKKRTEQLEILREKLRQRRAKIMKDSQDAFMDEVESTSHDGEERNLRRREIIDETKKNEEISDIVDREKLDYIMSNKPINYEAKKESYDTDVKEANEKGKKFVPEMTEIVRPVHETRERKVNPRKQTIKATNDPGLIAYEVPDEINTETMRKNLQEDVELTNHRIERREGKSYYAVVESLENPRIYENQHEVEPGEEASIEMADSTQQNGEEMNNYEDDGDVTEDHRDYRKHHRISDSNEETIQRLSNIENSSRLVKNTPNNKYMCLKENSEEPPSDNNEELFKLVKEKDHYVAMPVQEPKIDDKDKYNLKKKYVKNFDDELRQKYNRPKYERLAMDKTANVENGKIMRKNAEVYEVSDIQENDETLQEKVSKKIKKITRPSNDEIESWLVERNRENSKGQIFPTSDEIDLDEALNSSAYELLMLIPVSKNQRRRRQKRQVGNAISRDEEDSTLNDTPIEITMKKTEIKNMTNDHREDTTINEMKILKIDKNDENNEIATTEVNKIDETGRIKLSDILNDTDDENNSISDSSSSHLDVRELEWTKGKDRTRLKGHVLEKIVPNDPKKSVEDDGFPGLLEVALPRLEASVTTGLGKARRISENFEKYINAFDEGIDQEQLELEIERENSTKLEENVENKSPISSDIFGATFTNVKKFFDFLTDMVHTFRIN